MQREQPLACARLNGQFRAGCSPPRGTLAGRELPERRRPRAAAMRQTMNVGQPVSPRIRSLWLFVYEDFTAPLMNSAHRSMTVRRRSNWRPGGAKQGLHLAPQRRGRRRRAASVSGPTAWASAISRRSEGVVVRSAPQSKKALRKLRGCGGLHSTHEAATPFGAQATPARHAARRNKT